MEKNSDKITIVDRRIEKLVPKELEIYTTDGTFKLVLINVTREFSVVRVTYHHSTFEETDDPLRDGEPDYLQFDIHFAKENDGLKILLNITYGDSMKSEFSIKAPNKIEIGLYNGWNSKADSKTHFSFSDKSLLDLIQFFNRFDKFDIKRSDFNFLDKYRNSFKYNESIKLMPTFEKGTIVVIDNNRDNNDTFLYNVLKYLQLRGIPYKVAKSLEELKNCIRYENIIGAITTGSDLSVKQREDKNILNYWLLDNLNCPVIGICFGYQIMCKRYGSKIVSKDFIQDHLQIQKTQEHPLFNDIDTSTTKFSFCFKDFAKNCPSEFSIISKLDDDTICGVANDELKRYGFLFHPEDVDYTHRVLDNFINICHPIDDDVQNLKKGKFYKILNFNSYNY